MKKLIMILLGILVVPIIAFGQKKKVKNAQWQPNPIVVDGQLNDWTNPLMFVDKNTKLVYSINNDEENIYFCFKVADDITKMKLVGAGIIIGIDTTGKKRQGVSISYPMRSDTMHKPSGTTEPAGNRPNMDMLKKKFKEKPQSMVLNGFISGNGISSLENENGVKAKLDWDENDDIVYEITIPFKSFWQADLSEMSSSRIIALNVNIQALEKPSFGRQGRPNGTGRPGGGGGRPGGGRPSWIGGGSEEFTKLSYEQKLTIKFILAKSH